MADAARKPSQPRTRVRKGHGQGVTKARPKAGKGPWYPAFIGSLFAVGASVVVLILVLVSRFGGDDPVPAVAAPTEQATATGTAPSGQPSATATAVPTGYARLLPCGDILAPLDKEHSLAPDCEPDDLEALPASISAEGTQSLRRETAAAIRKLFAAAESAGFHLYVNSSFRSYATQVELFDYWVRVNGLAYAERTSARAGHSEHQLGTTADVGFPGHFLEDFTGTAEADWLAANSWKHGFIISYPEGKEAVTGYAHESWHIRYVGVEVAAKVHKSGLTLREYLLQR